MTSTNNNFPKFIHKKINLPKLKRFKDGRGKRYYENESGKKYVSVTTVLDAWPKPWLKTWEEKIGKDKAEEIRIDALEFGSSTHSVVEEILNNESGYIENDYFFAARALVKKLINGVNLTDILGIEKAVCSDNINVAGTIDLIVSAKNLISSEIIIFDFKTTKKDLIVREDHLIQCAAYAKLFEESSGISVDRIGIIQVSRVDFSTIISIKDPDHFYDLFLKKLENFNDLESRL